VYNRNSKGETKLHSACAKVKITFIEFHHRLFNCLENECFYFKNILNYYL